MDRILPLVAALASVVSTSSAQAPLPTDTPPRPPSPGTERPAEASPAKAEPQPTAKAIPRGSVLEEVSGTVRELDRKEHRLTVETATGQVTLSLDRNTMVYTAKGLGTVLDIAAGAQIRAGRNADLLAYWVQVRGIPASSKPSEPGGAPATAAPEAPRAPPGEDAGAAGGKALAPVAPAGGAPTGTGDQDH